MMATPNPFVKICGLANQNDTLDTIEAGPDALGFIFWPRSPRAVSPEDVAIWTKDLPLKKMLKVGVFVDASTSEIVDTVKVAGLDVVQLHGNESAEFAKGLRDALDVELWNVVHLDRLPDDYRLFPADRIVVDSGTIDMPGGTGKQVDVVKAAAFVRQSNLPVILAGGLNAGNIKNTLEVVHPAGVDISSGVERKPGEKNIRLVKEFITNARSAM